jgi:serine/threonine protein phosphatase PrpC
MKKRKRRGGARESREAGRVIDKIKGLQETGFDSVEVKNSRKGQVAFATDKGGRSENQDAMHVNMADEIYVVADGMGGYDKGHLSAQIVCEGIAVAMEEDANLITTHQEIRARLKSEGVKEGGAVYVAVKIEKKRLKIVVAGDASIFVLDDQGALVYRSSMGPVREGIRATTAGNAREQTSIEIGNHYKVLMVTDGVTDNMTDRQILEVLANHGTADVITELRRLSLIGMEGELEDGSWGNKDNVTALIHQVVPMA